MVKGFRVLHPGILTTYQDHGRRSGLQFGIPRSGAMDPVALRAANLLVGNSESEVGLEVTLMGLKLVAILPLVIAIAGADLYFTINSEYQPPWRSYGVNTGDILHFRRREIGLRAYLAVKGGFKAPTFMGSASVFQRGLMGKPLKKDDLLEIKSSNRRPLPGVKIPEELLPRISDQDTIRVIMGPQEERFKEQGIYQFLNSRYEIKPQSDRMAYRLNGPKINHRDTADIISEHLLPGAIQVPSDGCPIILMMDCQVTGGYAKIAHVISADLSLLAQKMPGEQLRFTAVDLDEAYEAMEQREQLILWLRKNMSLHPDLST
jgi:antagonist of KipI